MHESCSPLSEGQRTEQGCLRRISEKWRAGVEFMRIMSWFSWDSVRRSDPLFQLYFKISTWRKALERLSLSTVTVNLGNFDIQSFTGPWNTLLDETKRFLELKFSSIPSEFFLLSLYICILLYCRKAKLKVESISQYPCGNAKMGQRWNFCWAVREKSSENFQIFLILSLWE